MHIFSKIILHFSIYLFFDILVPGENVICDPYFFLSVYLKSKNCLDTIYNWLLLELFKKYQTVFSLFGTKINLYLQNFAIHVSPRLLPRKLLYSFFKRNLAPPCPTMLESVPFSILNCWPSYSTGSFQGQTWTWLT